MNKKDLTPLTDNERRYLELIEQPGPYRNPKWHDYESMTAAMGITVHEVREIEQGLTRKGYLSRKLGGLLYTRTGKKMEGEA